MISPEKAHARIIGARLRRAREAAKLTQAQLGKPVRLDQPTVSRIELGERPLQTHEAFQFARMLAVSSQDLIGPFSEEEEDVARRLEADPHLEHPLLPPIRWWQRE